jgi:hypothetical protein
VGTRVKRHQLGEAPASGIQIPTLWNRTPGDGVRLHGVGIARVWQVAHSLHGEHSARAREWAGMNYPDYRARGLRGSSSAVQSEPMVILGPRGKKLGCHVVETNASLLVDLLKTIPRPRHLCFEEGTQSAWLYETLSAHVDETVVTVKRERRGSKDDQRDALELADKRLTNSIEVRIYKEVGRYGRLRELSKAHRMQVRDSVRVQNRILALYRSRGIATDDSLYNPKHREEWIAKLPARMQTAADSLLRQYDVVEPLRRESEKTMVVEARKSLASFDTTATNSNRSSKEELQP